MVQQWDAIEVGIDGHTFWVRYFVSRVLESGRGGRCVGGIAGQAFGMGPGALLWQHRT